MLLSSSGYFFLTFSYTAMNVYGDGPTAKAFKEGFKKAGKKLDMGKSCVRFKTAEDLPLDVIGKTIAATSVKEFVGRYEKARKK